MVEKWLIEVEQSMIVSIKQVLFKSLASYAEIHRKKWVISWAGQVVLCISQTYWTAEVEEAIQAGKLAVSLIQVTVCALHAYAHALYMYNEWRIFR